MNLSGSSPTKAYIDLYAFNHNIKIIRNKFPKSMIILPVKANAYGHGDIIISREAEKIGIEYLAIARLEEGIKLRQNNITLPIINFGIELKENIDLAIENNIELSVSSIEYIKEIENKGKKKNINVPIHLKIDTGMRRLGCNYIESELLAKYIHSSPYLIFKSLYTHFARSDDDPKLTQQQANLFLDIKNKLLVDNIFPEFYHLFNSGAILHPPVINDNFAIRPGIMAYGYAPFNDKSDYKLMPVMTLVTKVIHIKRVPGGEGVSYGHTFKTKKPTILAIIPLGYGDGFPRILSNKFMVTINNNNYCQRGTISMDLTVIEVDNSIKIGDEVIIFGDKNRCINTANDLAKLANTISYEIITGLTERVERIII